MPLLAVLILTFLATSLVISLAGMELITLQRFQHDAALSERVGEGSIDNAINSSNSRMPKLIYVSRSLGVTVAFFLVLAAILTTAAAMMRATPRPGYTAMLGMVSFAFLPFALFQMIATGFMLSVNADHNALDLENLTGINAGRLFDRATANPALFELAMGLDLVSAGQVVFLAFGFSTVTGLPMTRCLAVCGSLWAVVILWKAALAGLF